MEYFYVKIAGAIAWILIGLCAYYLSDKKNNRELLYLIMGPFALVFAFLYPRTISVEKIVEIEKIVEVEKIKESPYNYIVLQVHVDSKKIVNSTENILLSTHVRKIKANSKEEAIGKFVIEIQELKPYQKLDVECYLLDDLKTIN